LDAILSAYRLQNKEANTKFKFDTDSLHMAEAQKVLQEEQLSAYNRYLGEFNKLQDQFNEKKRSGSESDRAMLPAITLTQNKLTKEYLAQKDAITGLVAERVKETQAKQLELFQTKEMISAQDKLKGIQDDIAKSTMSEIEKKYYDIDAAAKASAKTQIEAEEARRNAKMPIEEQNKYYEAALAGTDALKSKTSELYTVSREFGTGWKNAFNEYVDNATNAAQQAQRVFQAATQGMEDLLMGFFKTGKFGWKDFVQNIIDVMMRSQIQQLIAKTFGGIGSVGGGSRGGGGLFGGAIIPGFLASGGPASAGKPYIVGERGPELFVPNSSGSVIPNGALGGGPVTYNINAVDAMSFKQMLAQDPSFLHAVAEQGRRRIPGAR
jgi:phage-related minor tail protein